MKRTVLLTAIALACCLVVFPTSCSAARILGFFPAPSKSHLIIHTAIADTLARAGHNVTVISSLPNMRKDAKYHFVHIPVPTLDQTLVSDMVNKPKPIYMRFGTMLKATTALANATLSHPDMRKFLQDHDESTFDLVIVGYFMNDFQLGIGAHFKCPIVISFMIRSIYPLNVMIGNPSEFAYVPSLFGGLKQPMGFMDRVKNFLLAMFEQYFLDTMMEQRSQLLYKENFPPHRYPPLDEVKKNVSLILSNHHFSQGPIQPIVPGIVEIGGIQIKEKPDALPSDIAQILDNAKEGVIYFSLGSVVQGSIVSKEKIKIIFNVLSKVPYKVLWKWSDAELPGKSANIIYKSWLPQDDILAHPNVKLFITHGGQGSIVESQYHGVPMVGIPLFGDQPGNMVNVHAAGFGLSLDYITLSEEGLRTAVLEVLQNPKYAQAVKKFSQLYRDRPMTARQTLVYWIDYVLRHNGAKHMQSPAVFLNRFQLMSLDVLGFLFAIVAVVIFILFKLCKLCCCRGGEGKAKSERVTKSNKNK